MKPAQRMEVRNTQRLVAALSRAIGSFQPKVVVETGTYLGTGSTKAILAAFGERRPDVFYTLEVSKKFHDHARRNLATFPFVRCLWGLSVYRQEALGFVENDRLLKDPDPELDIFVDFLPDPVAGYLNEIRGGLGDESDLKAPEGILATLLERHKRDRPLICLDSAGGIGWLEFREVLRLQDGYPFLLFLDDINHVKHYRSKLFVEREPEFSVLDSDLNEGWMIAVRERR